MSGSEDVLLVPDAGPLITLAYADALDLLFKPGWSVALVDMVLEEITRNETPTSRRLSQWADASGIPGTDHGFLRFLQQHKKSSASRRFAIQRPELIKGIRVLAHHQDQRRGLCVGRCPPLFPILQGARCHAQPAGEDRPRDIQSLTGLPNQRRIDPQRRQVFHLDRAQGDLALPLRLHRPHPIHDLGEQIAFTRHRFGLLCASSA